MNPTLKTFPYLTTLNLLLQDPFILFDEITTLSAHNFVAP